MDSVSECDRSRLAEVIGRAEDLRKGNELPQAIQLLRDLMAEFPTAPIVRACLARHLSRDGQHAEAVERAQEAVQLSPKSEFASLALYLVLGKAGQMDSSLDEMKRFTVVGHSKEYSRLIKEFRRIMDEEDAK